MGISPIQLLIVLIIVIAIFGTKKLGGVGSDLGQAIKGFKNAMKEDEKPADKLEHQAEKTAADNRIIEGEAGELRLAVECHTCFDWLMPAMGEFRPMWPQVELDIVSGFQADPVGLLLQHRADLAIVSEAEKQNGISFRPLFAYEMVGICAQDHPLAAKTVWEAEDFIGETLITYPVPDEMLDLPKKILLPKGINPPRRRSELTIAIIQLVASKRGIAALPYWTVMPYLEKGYVVHRQITANGLQSELYAATRTEDADKSYLDNFCQIVRERSFADLPGLSELKMHGQD